MVRTVKLMASYAPLLELPATLVTPNVLAARAYGVPFISLETLARNTVQHAGWFVAERWVTDTLLRQAVREVLTPPDVVGTVRSVQSAVREVLALTPESSSAVASTEAHTLLAPAMPDAPDTPDDVAWLFALAGHYRELLRDRSLLDPAEVMSQAAQVVAETLELTITGYPFLRANELAFVDAMCAAGSQVTLPHLEVPLFSGNARAAALLASRGWTVTREQPPLASDHVASDPVGVVAARCYALGREEVAGVAEALEHLHGTSGASTGFSGVSYADVESEVRGVLTEVKRLLHAGVAADEIALVVNQDDRYGALVRAVAWEYELPVRTFYRVPARLTRLGQWLERLIAVLRSNGGFEATRRFLAHPLNPPVAAAVWDSLRQARPNTLRQWQQHLLEQVPEQAQALATLLAMVHLPMAAPMAAYCQQFAHIQHAFLPVTLAATDLPAKVLTKQIRTSLAYLLAEHGQEPWSLERFLDTLADIVSFQVVPSDSSKQGVPLHTPPAVLGTTYDYVFILGVAEGMLPAAIREDPRWDFGARKRLQQRGYAVTGAVEAAQRQRLLVYVALSSARKQLQLSYPKQAFGQGVLPSEVFARLGIVPAAVSKQAASIEEARAILLQTNIPTHVPTDLSTDTQLTDTQSDVLPADVVSNDVVSNDVPPNKVSLDNVVPKTDEVGDVLADAVLERARQAFAVEIRRESAEAHDAFDGVTGIPIDVGTRILSASQLVAFGQCSYRWFAQRVLRLEEPAEPDTELTPTLRGSLYHKVLELALAPLIDQDLTANEQRDIALAQLEDAFARAEKQVAVMRLPNWAQQRQEHVDHLKAIVQRDSFFQTGRVIKGLEQRFKTTWHDLTVVGVIDRVDMSADGLHFTDYKTSASKPKGAKDEGGKLKVDVQLPLYLQAAAPELYPNDNVADAQYYSLTKGETIANADVNDAELTRLAEQVKTWFAAGRFPVDPDAAEGACTYCPYDSLCRKGPRLARKRRQHADV